jgi:hypothetical protein
MTSVCPQWPILGNGRGLFALLAEVASDCSPGSPNVTHAWALASRLGYSYEPCFTFPGHEDRPQGSWCEKGWDAPFRIQQQLDWNCVLYQMLAPKFGQSPVSLQFVDSTPALPHSTEKNIPLAWHENGTVSLVLTLFSEPPQKVVIITCTLFGRDLHRIGANSHEVWARRRSIPPLQDIQRNWRAFQARAMGRKEWLD